MSGQAPPVRLVEVTAADVNAVCRLDVNASQRGFVAPNAMSIAEAYFEPAAWFRAIRAGDDLVGFAMLHDPTRTATPDEPGTCFLWRFMVDARHQRRGHGAAALGLLVAHVATLPGVDCFATSYVPAPGNASPLYRRFGFADTGEVDDGERVMRRPMTAADRAQRDRPG
jgi:diamine N-acetyltransferase